MPDGMTTTATATATSDNLLAEVSTIMQPLANHWPGNAEVGAWDFGFSVNGKPISVQPENSSQVYDYFQIELVGQSSLATIGNRAPAGYGLYVTYEAPTEPPAGLQLIAAKPDTTVASTTYDDTISWTATGSFGFSSDGGISVSFGGSKTMTHSTSTTVSDLQILNRSHVGPSAIGHWEYIVAAGSLEAQGATPLLAQMLLCRPHSADPLQIQVEVFAYFNNKGLSDNLNWTGLSQAVTGFNGDNLPPLENGNARIAMQYTLTIDAPPAPTAAS
ncbi:hypothetical protein V7S57_15780 [Caulobacter sp. CCNWLY153]|uniref:hypothetical protein n=1 Tax=unclassified Caulobacter TaxID=2648921 RepID=UPI002FF22759